MVSRDVRRTQDWLPLVEARYDLSIATHSWWDSQSGGFSAD